MNLKLHIGEMEKRHQKRCDELKQKLGDDFQIYKALVVIEHIACETGTDDPNDPMGDVYRFAHAALGRCAAKHGDWLEEIDRICEGISA